MFQLLLEKTKFPAGSSENVNISHQAEYDFCHSLLPFDEKKAT